MYRGAIRNSRASESFGRRRGPAIGPGVRALPRPVPRGGPQSSLDPLRRLRVDVPDRRQQFVGGAKLADGGKQGRRAFEGVRSFGPAPHRPQHVAHFTPCDMAVRLDAGGGAVVDEGVREPPFPHRAPGRVDLIRDGAATRPRAARASRGRSRRRQGSGDRRFEPRGRPGRCGRGVGRAPGVAGHGYGAGRVLLPACRTRNRRSDRNTGHPCRTRTRRGDRNTGHPCRTRNRRDDRNTGHRFDAGPGSTRRPRNGGGRDGGPIAGERRNDCRARSVRAITGCGRRRRDGPALGGGRRSGSRG